MPSPVSCDEAFAQRRQDLLGQHRARSPWHAPTRGRPQGRQHLHSARLGGRRQIVGRYRFPPPAISCTPMQWPGGSTRCRQRPAHGAGASHAHRVRFWRRECVAGARTPGAWRFLTRGRLCRDALRHERGRGALGALQIREEQQAAQDAADRHGAGPHGGDAHRWAGKRGARRACTRPRPVPDCWTPDRGKPLHRRPAAAAAMACMPQRAPGLPAARPHGGPVHCLRSAGDGDGGR